MNLEERIVADGYEGLEPILFYRPRDPFGWGSNFSKHKVVLPYPFQGAKQFVSYPTGEHRFQAMKASTSESHEYVRAASSPFDAKKRGGPHGIVLRPGWGNNYGDLCWYVMAEVVLHKALQHSVIKAALLITGDRPIYEDSPTDDIWGVRFESDYRGKNLLGRAWMEARAVIRGDKN